MPILYVCMKTLVTDEINFKTLGRDAYMEQTRPTAFAFAVDQEPAQCVAFPFPEEVHEAARGCAAGGSENWMVMGHNIDFHSAVWKKMGWPEPWRWGCTLKAARKEFVGQTKSFALDSLVELLTLPKRHKIDEANALGMGFPTEQELHDAAIRDVCLCRAVSEIILYKEIRSQIQ